MAYVQPNSVIQLFKGINLDNRYMHTIYFANESAQNSWFTSKVSYTFQAQSYVRYTRNSIKLKADTTDIMDCTYLRFKNDRSVDKWFYAFINAVEYVNENTCLVTYEIDVMQTWFIQNGSVRACMVLREHVTDDTFGHNLEAEPIGSEVYDNDLIYYFGKNGEDNPFASYSIVAQTTGASDTDAHLTQGLFSGCKYFTYEADSQGDANHIFAEIQSMLGSWSLQEQEEDVIDLYTVPTFCCGSNTGHLTTGADNIIVPNRYDNYTPKNKKLFMYPYSSLLVTTHTGDSAIYRWEYFDGSIGSSCQFDVDGTMIGGGEIRCYPRAYNGQENNVDAGLIMNNFPKNTANYDAYQAWIASGGSVRLDNERVVNSFKGVAGLIGVGSSLLSATHPTVSTVDTTERMDYAGYVGQTPIASMAQRQYQSIGQRSANIGGITGAVANAVGGIGGMIEAKNNMQYEFNDAVYKPNIVVGKPTCALPIAMRDANLYFFHNHVRDDEAKRIDDFFSCYGYTIKKVKVPNLTGRAYWNFIMTKDCVISGDMPATSKEAIARIFDSGITFWHNGDNVGNYAISTSDGSINNPIV